MKTLSVKNPHGYLIAYGAQDVENRTWPTAYRGPLLLHATGSPMDLVRDDYLPDAMVVDLDSEQPGELSEACLQLCEDCLSHLDIEPGASEKEIRRALAAHGPYISPGEVIGMVELVDVVRNSTSIWAQPGYYHWVLQSPVFFETTFAGIKGKLRLWDYEIPYIPKAL